MPKIKTHSGSKKRFKVTGKGKVKYKKPGQRHLLTGDSGNQNRKS
ncbi:MAG: 50S ribosomal protein L35, partial [Endomicrobium sp.]|nr:50S ribosomal protein L35 [Endomicrobium sp.]